MHIQGITGLWTITYQRHYIINVDYSHRWYEIDNGKIVRHYELIDVYGELEEEVTLLSENGKYMITPTYKEIFFTSLSREIAYYYPMQVS